MTSSERTVTPKGGDWTLAWDTAFEPYAQAIGYMLREWNHLQDQFAMLFETMVDTKNRNVPRVAWYAVPNDRFQRRMLNEVASELYGFDLFGPSHRSPKQKRDLAVLAEIDWAISSADKLGVRRDAAAHTPVAMTFNDSAFEFLASWHRGNPLAKSFKDADFLEELHLYRQRAVVIAWHVSAIHHFIKKKGRGVPFPKRPALPERQLPKKDAGSTRKGRSK